ncbi:MAG: phosphotransferase [Oscillospiraceae bacterium]|nr:phosphotransferase [Oscillospiraceae bacterium]
MNNDFGKLLASGTASDVYEYGSDKVCKLYLAQYNFDMVEWEYKKILEAYKIGIPAPKIYELIEHEGRFGIVMERFYGKTFNEILFGHIQANIKQGNSMQKIIESAYEIFIKQIKDIANKLFEVHQIKCKLFYTVKECFTNNCRYNNSLSPNEKDMIFKLIEDLPDSDSVCHGDPNLTNFIYHNDKILIVDWANCLQSSPLYDITNHVLGTAYSNPTGMPDEMIRFYSAHKNDFIKIFLDEYVKLSDIDLSDIERWIILLPVSRGSNIIGKKERQRLLDVIRDGSHIL